MKEKKSHINTKKRNKRITDTPLKHQWLYNPNRLTFEVNTMKLSNECTSKKVNNARDIFDQSTNLLESQNVSNSFIVMNRKLGNNISNKYVLKFVKLPFLMEKNENLFPQIINLTQKRNTSKWKERSDDFQYRKIFLNKRIFTNKKNYVENKLNIDYAESESQYEERLLKINQKLKEKGLRIKHENKSDYLTVKLKDLQDKMIFMKGVVDYSYPSFVVTKIKEINKVIKQEMQQESEEKAHKCPYEIRSMTQKQINKKRKEFLIQSIQITH